jgi:hypothetical protein
MIKRDIMKFMLYHEWKFKQRWSTSPPISTKQTITTHLHSQNAKKDHDI